MKIVAYISPIQELHNRLRGRMNCTIYVYGSLNLEDRVPSTTTEDAKNRNIKLIYCVNVNHIKEKLRAKYRKYSIKGSEIWVEEE